MTADVSGGLAEGWRQQRPPQPATTDCSTDEPRRRRNNPPASNRSACDCWIHILDARNRPPHQLQTATPAKTATTSAPAGHPSIGSVTDCAGNTWTINSNNKILENGTPVLGGGDTAALTLDGSCTVYGLSNGNNSSKSRLVYVIFGHPRHTKRGTTWGHGDPADDRNKHDRRSPAHYSSERPSGRRRGRGVGPRRSPRWRSNPARRQPRQRRLSRRRRSDHGPNIAVDRARR